MKNLENVKCDINRHGYWIQEWDVYDGKEWICSECGTVEDEIVSYNIINKSQDRVYGAKAELSRKDDIDMNGVERTVKLDLDGATVCFNMTKYYYETEYEFLDRAREYVSRYMVVDIAQII